MASSDTTIFLPDVYAQWTPSVVNEVPTVGPFGIALLTTLLGTLGIRKLRG